MLFGKKKTREERLQDNLERARKNAAKARQIEDETKTLKSLKVTEERLKSAKYEALDTKTGGILSKARTLKERATKNVQANSKPTGRTPKLRSGGIFSTGGVQAPTLGGDRSPFQLGNGPGSVIYGKKRR